MDRQGAVPNAAVCIKVKFFYSLKPIIGHINSLFGMFCMYSGEETFYPTAHTLGVGEHKDSEEGINRMCADLEKQYV